MARAEAAGLRARLAAPWHAALAVRALSTQQLSALSALSTQHNGECKFQTEVVCVFEYWRTLMAGARQEAEATVRAQAGTIAAQRARIAALEAGQGSSPPS